MTDYRDPWTARLSEYVDGELDAPERVALEAHLSICAECRSVRDDLQRVVARARRVTYREPPRDLWSGIETSIADTAARHRRRVVTLSLARLVAAAAIVAMVAGGVAWTIATRRAINATATVVARDTASEAPVLRASGSAAIAVASYREAAADLERALEAGRSTLRPETMRVIENNLRAIDLAIAQADSALRRDPGSAYLNQYLAATMQRKLKLLRRAVEITSRS
jgi:anti-sigma factor RsiW